MKSLDNFFTDFGSMIKLNISATHAWRIYNCIASALLFVAMLLTVVLPFWWWNPADPHISEDIWAGEEAVQEVVKGARAMQMMGLLFFFAAFFVTFFSSPLAAFLIFLGGKSFKPPFPPLPFTSLLNDFNNNFCFRLLCWHWANCLSCNHSDPLWPSPWHFLYCLVRCLFPFDLFYREILSTSNDRRR